MNQPTTAQTPPQIDQVEILSIPIAKVNYSQVINWIDEACQKQKQGYICVAATHTVVACQDDNQLRQAVLSASFTVPDGQPLVWALRALGHRLEDRVYGPELMARYCDHAQQTDARIFLYGGRNDAALSLLTDELLSRFPNLNIVGTYCPPFRPLTAHEVESITKQINQANPDVVWVGIGVPKQEKWMATMRTKLVAPVLIGVGAAFDFHANLIPQAPPWMQRCGLEWAYRLSREPKRLWRRYLNYNPRFVIGFVSQYWRYLRRK